MTKKCIGCGCLLQYEDKNKEGYIREDKYETSKYCERCFKIINYGEYKKVIDKKEDYINIYKSINKTDDLVLYLVDIFNINSSIDLINKYINNRIILVLTKRDILPLSINESKIIKYIKNYNFNNNIIGIVLVSSKNNYNMDELYDAILKYKTSNNVYVCGNTNAGKSTLINKFIKNYSNEELLITTSILPSTTLDINEVKINDKITFLDTPGFIEDDNISNYVSEDLLKKIMPNREIKPISYRMRENMCLYLKDLLRIEYVKGEENSFTLFLSNDIIVERINIETNNRGKELVMHELLVPENSDVLVNGLCFIKIVKEAKIRVYTLDNVSVSIRKSLI